MAVSDLISGYLKEIEKLHARLIESEQLCQQLNKSLNSPRNNMNRTYDGKVKYIFCFLFTTQNIICLDDPAKVIDIAKRELEKEREILMSRSLPGFDDNTENAPAENDSSAESGDSDSEDNGRRSTK